MKYYYGVKSLEHVKELAREVIKGLGGNENVYRQMLGTAAAETRCGTYPDDNPEKLGVGLYQHDHIRLIDIQNEGEKRHFDIVKKLWGYDIPTIHLADLAYDPLLSTICARLGYKRIPEACPENILDQAMYWKKYWNTYHPNAKGTPEHYLECVEQVLGENW